MMTYTDITNKSTEELTAMLAEQREALRKLRFEDSERQLKAVRKIRDARRMVSWIETALSSKVKATS